MTESAKRKQKPKQGRVVRLTPDLALFLEKKRLRDETVAETFRRLLSPAEELSRFVLPSDIFETIEEARGAAVLRRVRSKGKQIEKPIKVRVA